MSEPGRDPAGEPPTGAEPVPAVPARRYTPPPRLRRYLRRLPRLPGGGAFGDR